MDHFDILIVDDEENILKALRRELNDYIDDFSDKECILSRDARIAMEILEKRHHRISLIISDLKMPGMSGSDFLIEVKKKYPQIVSIIISGYSELSELIKAVKAGCFSYILKPWDRDFLKEEVRKAEDIFRMQYENKAYQRRIKEELKWGGELQKKLLERNLPDSKKINFHVTYQPLPELYCGGDYYDIIKMEESAYLILIGDVSGHGLKAAFITAILKSIIYSGYVGPNRDKSFSPADFLSWLSSQFLREISGISNMILTFCAIYIDLDSSRMRIANAGHCPPLLRRKGKVHQINCEGSAIGIEANLQFKNYKLSLQKGDTLFLYTDGLIELKKDGQHQDFKGLNELLSSLETLKGMELHQGILKEINKQFYKAADDIAILTADFY